MPSYRPARPLRRFAASCLAAAAGVALAPVAVQGAAGDSATSTSPAMPAAADPASSPTAANPSTDRPAAESLTQQEAGSHAAANLLPRQRVVNQVNQRRQNNGLRQLDMAPRPRTAAMRQSNHQANIATVTHRGPKGGNAGHRLRAAGYPWGMWGEAVAGGYKTPRGVVTAWMNSPSHRDILMHPRAYHIGVWSTTDDNGRRYWTLVVASR